MKAIEPCVDPLDDKDTGITWFCWEVKEIQLGERKSRRMMKVHKRGTILDLLHELIEEVKPLSKHFFLCQVAVGPI